jgi:hypothetical protein
LGDNVVFTSVCNSPRGHFVIGVGEGTRTPGFQDHNAIPDDEETEE